MTKRQQERGNRLMPESGTPRYVRCYDNGGDTIDRYTVVYSGLRSRQYLYVGMGANPSHAQGVCQHGEGRRGQPIDVVNGWPPAIGRRNHLGTRVAFADLPPVCQRVVRADYRELWGI